MEPKHLPKLGHILAKHRGVTLATLSTDIAGGGHVLGRLERSEQSITYAKLERLMKWFSSNWPTDLDWPADIPRPDPTPKQKESAA